ncbi:MAG: transglutaminase-like cysteine peptidase [Stellaceae bacterium]
MQRQLPSTAQGFGIFAALAAAFNSPIPATRPALSGFFAAMFDRQLTMAADASPMGPMPRWRRVMTRFAEERADPAAFCTVEMTGTCPRILWQDLVARLRLLPLGARVALVNQFFNRRPYVPAAANWGRPGYWETPYEFLARGGQCQDFAIAKFLALLQSGVPERDLRFVVVRDAVSGLDHAITVVDLPSGPVALDNQMPDATPLADLASRYQPYYALNDRGWITADVPDPTIAMPSPSPPTLAFNDTFEVARY